MTVPADVVTPPAVDGMIRKVLKIPVDQLAGDLVQVLTRVILFSSFRCSLSVHNTTRSVMASAQRETKAMKQTTRLVVGAAAGVVDQGRSKVRTIKCRGWKPVPQRDRLEPRLIAGQLWATPVW